MKLSILLLLLNLAAGAAQAQSKPALDPHVRRDIERHRAMAKAHEEAARCLEAGQAETQCLRALQTSCKGLGIGKYCGLKHEH